MKRCALDTQLFMRTFGTIIASVRNADVGIYWNVRLLADGRGAASISGMCEALKSILCGEIKEQDGREGLEAVRVIKAMLKG